MGRFLEIIFYCFFSCIVAVMTNAGFHGAYPHTYTQEVGVGGVLVPHGGEVLHHGGDGDVGEDERGEWRWVGDGR